MSIIIRLQNLPLNAKSGDIRHFFGGLRIPDGGVHILGGDKGDAFIAFMSDEDGRLAMRKDGGKIKDSRVSLFLSSRMEMQHEVEKLTKNSLADTPSSKGRSSGDDSRSSERRRSPYSRRSGNEYRQRSRSPVMDKTYSSKRSPPKRHVASHRSSPSEYRSVKREKRSPSPEVSGHSSLAREMKTESKSLDPQPVSQSQLQAELERRITEELEKNDLYKMIIGEDKPPEWNVGGFSPGIKDDLPFNSHQLYRQGYAPEREPPNFMPFQAPCEADRQYEVDRFHSGFSTEGSKMEDDMARPRRKTFFVLLTGLNPKWDYRKVQMILKGYFAPQGHIRFDRNREGLQNGKAVVKVANEDDYESIKKMEEVTMDGFKIKFSKCSFGLLKRLFPVDVFSKQNFDPSQDLCYTLKGIPFSCRYENVVQFFQGYEIADLVIIYRSDGKATGTGFVRFKTVQDYEGAATQNGKKIFHRFIEMVPCSLKDMTVAKSQHASSQSPPFVPYSAIVSEKRFPTRRPLCALLTGLPPRTTAKKIGVFFSKSDLVPDAIHLTVNNKKLSDGRGFVEFSNFLDFEAALKFHGEKLDDNIICVKQILFDEMVKILDSQKARHHFNTPAPPIPALNIPERVPYLWEPPDADPPMGFEGASPHHSETALAPPSFQMRHFEKPFDSNVKPALNEFFDPYSNRETYPAVSFPPPAIPQNPDLNVYERMLHLESLTEERIHPMDTSRNSDMGAKISELFDSFKKYEDNIKTSRLSPENEAALLKFLSSKKSPDFDGSERGDASPDSFREGSLGMSESSQDKAYKSEEDSRHYDDSASSSFLPEKKIVGCVVHISNVSVAASTADLTNFLKGFDYFENTLIRRYTDTNAPTNDVRVTFLSRREAERAVRVLDRHYLHNMAVRLNIL